MHWYQTISEMISMRSFSSVWYWIVVAVMWSMSSHWVIGVPFDMIVRARRKGNEAADQLDTLTHIYAERLANISGSAGVGLVAFVSFLIAMLGSLGFLYDIELAQALFFLLVPMTLVFILSIRTARHIAATRETGPPLWRRLGVHRFTVQAIGMVSLFLTAMYGMWHNLAVTPFN